MQSVFAYFLNLNLWMLTCWHAIFLRAWYTQLFKISYSCVFASSFVEFNKKSIFKLCIPRLNSHQNKMIRLTQTLSGKISNSLQKRHVLTLSNPAFEAIPREEWNVRSLFAFWLVSGQLPYCLFMHFVFLTIRFQGSI